jgi:hypothetical protein
MALSFRSCRTPLHHYKSTIFYLKHSSDILVAVGNSRNNYTGRFFCQVDFVWYDVQTFVEFVDFIITTDVLLVLIVYSVALSRLRP